MSSSSYEVPGNNVYEGIVYHDGVTPQTITQVATLKSRPGDVLISSFPRSGSTWTIEIVSAILNNGDIDSLYKVPQFARSFFLEHLKPSNDLKGFDNVCGFDFALAAKGGRIMRTHLQVKYTEDLILKEKIKTIMITRNPKDVLVSLYHFYQSNIVLGHYDKDWDHFFQLFKMNKLIYGSWLEYVKNYWKFQDVDNVLCLQYEEIKKDTKGTIRKIAAFLKQVLTEESMEAIAHYVAFEQMKDNPMVTSSNTGYFREDIPHVRKGIVGGWKDYFSKEQNEFVEENLIQKAKEFGCVFAGF